MHAYSKPQADDRAHERRYQHGADDYGCRVGVEAQRGYEYCQNQNQYAGAFERHAFADGSFGLGLAHELAVEAEIIYKEVADSCSGIGFHGSL